MLYKLNDFISKKRIISYFKKISIEPNYEKKFIFIPLHYQPEASTSPKGDVFVYQSLMIEMISNSIRNSDWIIYIKEHPYQNPTFGRDKNFYSEINKLSNVFFLKNNVDQKKLLIRSKAVGIVTGTMGLEAIANEVPVLCFGNVYYKFFEGVFAIETIDDLSYAINKIKRGYKVNSVDLIDSFKKIPKNYFQGYSNYEFEKVSNISHKKNIINLVNNLYGFLQKTKLIR